MLAPQSIRIICFNLECSILKCAVKHRQRVRVRVSKSKSKSFLFVTHTQILQATKAYTSSNATGPCSVGEIMCIFIHFQYILTRYVWFTVSFKLVFDNLIRPISVEHILFISVYLFDEIIFLYICSTRSYNMRT